MSKKIFNNILIHFQRQRQRESAAIKIQSWSRSQLSRFASVSVFRQECDELLGAAKTNGVSETSLRRMVALSVHIHRPEIDGERLVR